ncbi:MAG: hypothetical protein AB7O65_14860 [Candidatus Korobacteraceae bacterium]
MKWMMADQLVAPVGRPERSEGGCFEQLLQTAPTCLAIPGNGDFL